MSRKRSGAASRRGPQAGAGACGLAAPARSSGPSVAPPDPGPTGETAREHRIVFLPSGRRGTFPAGTSVLDAARRLGVDVDSICGGRGICGRCQVEVVAGGFPKLGLDSHPEHLGPETDRERRYRARKGLAAGRRLACSAPLGGDVVVDVPAESQIHRQVVRKDADARAVALDPLLRLHYVELAPARIGDQRSDSRRLRDALAEQWQLDIETLEPAALRALSGALRAGDWKVTVAVRDEARVVAAWPGFRDRLLGVAIDVGTTTLAAHLCDLGTGTVLAAAGAMNPQIRFGEDLISRVSYVQQHPLEAGAPTAAVRAALARLVAETAAQAGADAADVLDVTVVGNPIMHHLLLGLDPVPLARAPFPLGVDEAVELPAAELGLGVHPGARVYALPCIAGHVGADTAGVLLAEAPQRLDGVSLLVDVGTNAEIVLATRERILACSSPTGPAFEGAQVSCGQRAAPGAIERVRIDPQTLAPRFKVIGSEEWSDSPRFAASVEGFGVTGICGSGIIEAVAELFLAGALASSGLLDGERFPGNLHLQRRGEVFDYRLHAGPPEILVTQTDVRSIQLAKAALYAGTELLLQRMGVATVDRIVLAGAFGSYIDPRHAMVLGMIPDCPLGQVRAAGNAAGTGARIALLSRAARREVEALVRRVEKLETAAAERFQRCFVEAMPIPHRRHRFPHLEAAGHLPATGAGP